MSGPLDQAINGVNSRSDVHEVNAAFAGQARQGSKKWIYQDPKRMPYVPRQLQGLAMSLDSDSLSAGVLHG